MDFGTKKTPIEIIKERISEELLLETFIMVIMVNGTEKHGKNWMS